MPKRSVLLVYDVDGWAWHYMSRGIAKYAPEDIEVGMLPISRYAPDFACQFDAVLFWHWSTPELVRVPVGPRLVSVLAHDAVLYRPDDYPSDQRAVATSGFRNRDHCLECLAKVNACICVNPKLAELASSVIPSTYMRPGVDLEIFRPMDRTEKHWHSNLLVVGWCGQCPAPEKSGQKGYKEILSPLRNILKDDPIAWSINDRGPTQSPLMPTEMAKWLNICHLFLSTSLVEGSQMPLIEAGACGLPLLATEVGDAANVIPEGCETSLLPSPNTGDLQEVCILEAAHKIRKFEQNRELLAMRAHDCEEWVRERFDWKTLAPQWLGFILGDQNVQA